MLLLRTVTHGWGGRGRRSCSGVFTTVDIYFWAAGGASNPPSFFISASCNLTVPLETAPAGLRFREKRVVQLWLKMSHNKDYHFKTDGSVTRNSNLNTAVRGCWLRLFEIQFSGLKVTIKITTKSEVRGSFVIRTLFELKKSQIKHFRSSTM